MQVASVELEAAASAPNALSAAGVSLLQDGLRASAEGDWPAAVTALLGVTNQDSADHGLLEQVWLAVGLQVQALLPHPATASSRCCKEWEGVWSFWASITCSS